MLNPVREEIICLAEAYGCDELDEAGVIRLEELLRLDNRHIQFYVEYMDQLSVLSRRLLVNESQFGMSEVMLKRPAAKSRGRAGSRLALMNVIVSVALLLGGIGLWQVVVRSPLGMQLLSGRSETPVARIVQSIDGQWTIRRPQGTLSVSSQDDREQSVLFEGDEIEMEHGLLEIDYFSGVKLYLHGQTRCQLTGTKQGVLVSGKAVAEVAPSAIGFRLDTPTVKVCDLGTRFSLSSDGTGNSELSVSDGHVMVAVHKPGEEDVRWQSVHQGQTVSYLPNIGFIETKAYSNHVFDYVASVFEGISDYQGRLVVCRDEPQFEQTREMIAALTLVRGKRFDIVIPLDVVKGAWRADQSEVQGHLPVHQPADVILLQLSALDQNDDGPVSGAASFRFTQPIIGAIVTSKGLDELESQMSFPRSASFRGRDDRGLEGRGVDQPDSVRISADRYSIEVQLSNAHSVDQICVLTSSQ